VQLWKAGCGVMLLGGIATLGSCGLFGLAIDRQLDQRQIATLNLSIPRSPARADFEIDESSKLRLDFEAVVRPSEDDFAKADSSATIATSRLPIQYRVLSREGQVLDRGAGDFSGSGIIPETERRARSSFGEEITLSFQSNAFEAEGPALLTLEAEFPAEDDDGRELLRVRAEVFDRIGGNAGGWAAGGLLSLLVGPLIASLGLVLLVIGIIVHQQRKPS